MSEPMRLSGIALLALLLWTAPVAAGVPLKDFGERHVSVRLLDLPDTPQYYYEGTKFRGHVDIGYAYNQFDVLGIPLWNYDGKYCGYIEDATGFLEIEDDLLRKMTWDAGLRFPSPRLPFWHVYGGKLLLLLLVVLGRCINLDRRLF